ncbi:uncharacterized protein V6R79_014643 [Siganus canaliculatus]
MVKRYSTKEALEKILAPEPMELDCLSSESGTDTSEEDEEFLPGGCSNSSSSTDSSDCMDEAGDEDEHVSLDLPWMSKNKEIRWARANDKSLPFNHPGTGLTPGPTRYAVARVGKVVESFDLFFTSKMVKLVTDYSNLHGRRTVTQWKDVDVTTMRAYIGLLLLAGVYQSHGEASHSLWDAVTGRHIFRATMSAKTFIMMNHILRFDDRLSRSRRQRVDKLAAVREIWDFFTEQLPLMYNPGEDVCVDEQLVRYRGRCPFRQYMPKKPARYGIKMWVTCDVKTSYAWRVAIYTGRAADEPAERKQGRRVVLEMTDGLRGVTVTCDNFFSSFGLTEELLRKKIYLVGTIRKNRPELPPELLRLQGREILSSTFAFTATPTLVSYIPKRAKNVVLLSTKHRAPEISSGEKRKPQMIVDYNSCKGGVDTMDKMISTYTCSRRTRRWPLAIFFNMLDMSALNAYVTLVE